METRWALVLLLTLKESDRHDFQMGEGGVGGHPMDTSSILMA